MSTSFLLKYFPGVGGKKTTSELQECRTESEMTEQILNQIHEQHQDSTKHSLDQASIEDSNHPTDDGDDDDELPVSTYSDYSLIFDSTRSLAIILTSSDATEAQEIVLARARVLPGNAATRATVSMSKCCRPVFQMLQTVRTAVAFWTRFGISTSMQPVATDALQDESLPN